MAHPNAAADAHLVKHLGSGYTTSGATITVTGSIDSHTKASLDAGLAQVGLFSKAVAGVLTYSPR